MTTRYYAVLGDSGRVSVFGRMQNSIDHAAWLAGKGAVEITLEQNAAMMVGGQWRVTDGQLQVVEPAALELSVVKARAVKVIDASAERARMLVLTPGIGQSMEYSQAEAEARAAALAPDPLEPEVYPFLTADQQAVIAAGGSSTLREAADRVMAAVGTWTEYGAQIRQVRLTAKLLVGTAEDAGTVAQVLSELAWPTP